jgi:cyclophilin family peptidyl-prolyl cis-trans isomerase/protein-disulfide isomerase
MKKSWLFLVLVAVLALTACKPKSVITSSAPQPTATSAVEAAVPTPTDAVIVSSSIPSICTVTTLFATPEPTEAAVLSLFDPISAEDHRLGELDAKVTFLEYSDFQCPYCAAIAPVLEQLQAEYPQDVQVVFRNFPINGHPNALITAQAAEAAALQGKFWEMHDTIFATQQTWSEITVEQVEEMLIAMAENLGLDVEQFTADLKSDLIVARVLEDQAKAVEIGIPGTPFLLINGRIYQGQSDLASLQSIVKLLLLEDRQFSSCPELTVDMDREYLATVKTEKGDFVIRLFADKAPTTVNSFIFLSRNGWFDDIIFHRVLPGFVAQTGDPTGTGYAGPGYFFGDEINADLRFDRKGLVAMANAGSGTNGSQFFITYDVLSDLDGKYTIFGEVISGMEVVEALTPRDPSSTGVLPDGDKILSITIEEK